MRPFSSVRARRQDMLQRERHRLAKLLGHYLAGLGGQVEPLFRAEPGPQAVSIETRAGRLRVTCYGNWLACRFDEPESAKALLPYGPGQRLNSFSGKWNFNFGRVTADEALAAFRAELEPILPSPTSN